MTTSMASAAGIDADSTHLTELIDAAVRGLRTSTEHLEENTRGLLTTFEADMFVRFPSRKSITIDTEAFRGLLKRCAGELVGATSRAREEIAQGLVALGEDLRATIQRRLAHFATSMEIKAEHLTATGEGRLDKARRASAALVQASVIRERQKSIAGIRRLEDEVRRLRSLLGASTGEEVENTSYPHFPDETSSAASSLRSLTPAASARASQERFEAHDLVTLERAENARLQQLVGELRMRLESSEGRLHEVSAQLGPMRDECVDLRLTKASLEQDLTALRSSHSRLIERASVHMDENLRLKEEVERLNQRLARIQTTEPTGGPLPPSPAVPTKEVGVQVRTPPPSRASVVPRVARAAAVPQAARVATPETNAARVVRTHRSQPALALAARRQRAAVSPSAGSGTVSGAVLFQVRVGARTEGRTQGHLRSRPKSAPRPRNPLWETQARVEGAAGHFPASDLLRGAAMTTPHRRALRTPRGDASLDSSGEALGRAAGENARGPSTPKEHAYGRAAPHWASGRSPHTAEHPPPPALVRADVNPPFTSVARDPGRRMGEVRTAPGCTQWGARVTATTSGFHP